MLPVVPLDYERFTVIHSPLLMSEAAQNTASMRTRIAEPADPSAATQKRHEPLAQEFSSQLVASVDMNKSINSSFNGPTAGNSHLSVELSSVVGISPEVLFAETGSTKIDARTVAERYELSDSKRPSTLNIAG